jgi:hypothetical protein
MMNKKKFVYKNLVLALVLIGAVSIYWYCLSPSRPVVQDQQMMQAMNECDGIADKAVINLQEFLEFQKIEKLARKSRVMQLCMSDRGYRVNPAWLNSHQAEAHALALRENISDDAAVEELKRQHMYPSSVQETPFFWTAMRKKTNS